MMGIEGKCDICGGFTRDYECIRCYRRKIEVLELQLREAQEVITLCVDQGGLSFHVEGGKCPEDDTCDCPVAKKVNAAMKGYEGPSFLCLTCGEGHRAGSKCAEKRTEEPPKIPPIQLREWKPDVLGDAY